MIPFCTCYKCPLVEDIKTGCKSQTQGDMETSLISSAKKQLKLVDCESTSWINICKKIYGNQIKAITGHLTLPCHQRGEPPHRNRSRHNPALEPPKRWQGLLAERGLLQSEDLLMKIDIWKLKLRSMFSERMEFFGLNMISTKIF